MSRTVHRYAAITGALKMEGATIADIATSVATPGVNTKLPTEKAVRDAIAALKLDDCAAPDDNTDLNATTAKHGLCPKAPNDATKFLDGTAAYDTVKDSDLSVSDIATNNASTSAHGFLKKLPNTYSYMNGKGDWTTGGIYVPRAADPAAFDFTLAALTTDGTYRDLDCSGVAPAGTTAIHFFFRIKDDAVGNIFRLQPNSGAVDYRAAYQYTNVANEYITCIGIVQCDASRVVEYYATNTVWTDIDIVILGWFI